MEENRLKLRYKMPWMSKSGSNNGTTILRNE